MYLCLHSLGKPNRFLCVKSRPLKCPTTVEYLTVEYPVRPGGGRCRPTYTMKGFLLWSVGGILRSDTEGPQNGEPCLIGRQGSTFVSPIYKKVL